MSETAQRGGRPQRPWVRRIVVAIGLFLVVGFLGSFLGFNLFGAVFSSGPIVGRLVDANGQGIPGAFVSYEWNGRSYHGSTGCKAAVLVRTGPEGAYVVPWQGWRLLFATGWGISPVGPAVWAPGYTAKSDGRGGTEFVKDNGATPNMTSQASGVVDKGQCFGSAYRSARGELKVAQFEAMYDRVCVSKASARTQDLTTLYGYLIDAAEAGGSAPSTSGAMLRRKYKASVEQMAWPKPPSDPEVVANNEQRDGFCSSVKTDYLASGGHLK